MDIRKRTLALLLASCMLTVPACSEKTVVIDKVCPDLIIAHPPGNGNRPDRFSPR